MALESRWELTRLAINNLLNSVVNQIIERFQLVMKTSLRSGIELNLICVYLMPVLKH